MNNFDQFPNNLSTVKLTTLKFLAVQYIIPNLVFYSIYNKLIINEINQNLLEVVLCHKAIKAQVNLFACCLLWQLIFTDYLLT